MTTGPASPGSVDRADRHEAVRQGGSRRERGHQRVVVATAEDELHRVDAQRRADGVHRVGELEGVAVEVDGDAGVLGEVTDVGDQAVRDVDHRGGARPARRPGPASYGGCGRW